MLMLRSIPPPGKLQSTIQGLKMHRIDDWVYDVSDDMRVGGMYTGELVGPTPRELVPPNIASIQPPGNFPLPPQYIQPSIAALDLQNWGM
jgi:hypothetical protein